MKITFSQVAIIGTIVIGFGVLLLLIASKNSNVEAKYREVVNVFDIARGLEMDIEKFKNDIDSESVHNRVKSMAADGTERLGGAASTPAVFVNGELYNLRDFAQIKADLEVVKAEAVTDEEVVFPVNMEVFIDYNCSFCYEFEQVVEQLRAEVPDYANIEIKQLPFLRASSTTYAYAAEAAKEQGKFDEFNSELFNQVHGE